MAIPVQTGSVTLFACKETPLFCPANDSCRADENGETTCQENHHIECQPQKSRPLRWKLTATTTTVEKHIHQVGSRMRTDIQTEQNADNPIRKVCAGYLPLVIEQAAVGNPDQDESPQHLNLAPTLDLVHKGVLLHVQERIKRFLTEADMNHCRREGKAILQSRSYKKHLEVMKSGYYFRPIRGFQDHKVSNFRNHPNPVLSSVSRSAHINISRPQAHVFTLSSHSFHKLPRRKTLTFGRIKTISGYW